MHTERACVLGEAINGELKQHVGLAQGWDHARQLADWHAWVERFDASFGLHLQTPAITIERLSKRYGHYRPGRNGFGLQHEIALDEGCLQLDPVRVLGTLLHECLHLWQALHGRAGRNNYHNVEFRAKARSLGLIVDARGFTRFERGPFTELLERHGLPVEPLYGTPALERPPPRAQKLKKLRCGCTSIWAAVVVHATCLQCGREFRAVARS